ncbi:protein yippee-like 2 [Alligator mississippiensis]|uniref:Protein yippee-like 2 n=1 Tax=Alligator mississippiensis TaxID=8496 RepID=A0A151N683_ALLMI|nr:protein yippee-like 2 [Alligator mississippiensis]
MGCGWSRPTGGVLLGPGGRGLALARGSQRQQGRLRRYKKGRQAAGRRRRCRAAGRRGAPAHARPRSVCRARARGKSAWPCSPPTGISSSAAISCVWSLPHTIPCQTTAFTCVFRCFPCDPSCGSASWATPEFTQHSVAPMVKMTRSKTFQAYLPSCHRTYSCIHCRAHLANHDELISKSFQGSQGRAYLFNSVVNVGCGPAEERVLLTGLHAVADIYCENCKTTLGWKYEHAFESSQKYKEGKYIIELAHMIKDNGWD